MGVLEVCRRCVGGVLWVCWRCAMGGCAGDTFPCVVLMPMSSLE